MWVGLSLVVFRRDICTPLFPAPPQGFLTRGTCDGRYRVGSGLTCAEAERCGGAARKGAVVAQVRHRDVGAALRQRAVPQLADRLTVGERPRHPPASDRR